MVQAVLGGGACGDSQVVGDNDQGRSPPGALGLQELHDGGTRVHVQRPGGLVGQDDPRPAGDGPGDGHPLLLATGQEPDR